MRLSCREAEAPHSMAVFLAAAYLLAGLGVAWAVWKRPWTFWEVFVVVLIATSGLKMLGQVVVDEYVAALLVAVLGILLWKKRISLARPDQGTLARIHRVLFFVLMGYLFLQAVRGLFVLDDPRMIRWIGAFVLIGVLGYLLPRLPFPRPRAERVSFLIVLSSSAYFLVYMASGIIAEFVRGISRYDLQHLEWAGTAGAVIPVLFALPAMFLLWEKAGSWRRRALIMASYAVIIIMSFYYDSRAVWFVILGFTIAVFILGVLLRRRSIAAAGFLFFAVFALMFQAQVPLGQTNLGFERFLPVRTERIVSFLPQKGTKPVQEKEEKKKYEKPGLAAPIATSFESNEDRILMTEATYRAVVGSVTKTLRPAPEGKTESGKEGTESASEKPELEEYSYNISALLWGRGWYVARVTLAEYLIPLHEEYGLPTSFVYSGNKIQPSGFAALLIDTGLFGMLLIIATGAVTLLRLFQRGSAYGLYAAALFAGILGSMFLWLFVANITPFLLLYIVIAPGGILFLMRPREEGRSIAA